MRLGVRYKSGLRMFVAPAENWARHASLADVECKPHCRKAELGERVGRRRYSFPRSHTLENATNANPTIDTLLRYAEVVGKRLRIQVVDP